MKLLHWSLLIRGRRYKGLETLNLNKIPNRCLDWKIAFICHCGNDLLTGLHTRFLKFKENVPKNGRRTNNSLLGTDGIICLGTYNFYKTFLIHWSVMLTGELLHLKIFLRCSTFIWRFSMLELSLEKQNRSVWTKRIFKCQKQNYRC